MTGALKTLASLKLTLLLILLLGATVLAASNGAMAFALALLALNLGAAILVNPVFRAQLPLLVFHLALLALVALAAAGRLTYLKGRVELSAGETFSGELAWRDAGLLHRSRLAEIAFTNHGFTISYSAGLNRNETRNHVSFAEGGMPRADVIGDQRPLVLQGYRFYTSPNKGFAPVLVWRTANGSVHRGSVHLPSYPMYDYKQAQEWNPPESDAKLWLMLDLEEKLIDPGQASEFRLPRSRALIVRAGESRVVLKPGERTALAGGVLAYEDLTTWMGYNVFYDWTLPWLLAAGLLAVLSLAWHFWRKFSREAWDA